MRIVGRVVLIVVGMLGLVQGAARSQAAAFDFLVLGHIRGGDDHRLHVRLGELMDRVREIDPDLIVLTGDIIWGDYHNFDRTPEVLHAEWDAVDSALALIGVPILRVPGNHDASDLVSRDVYRSRYGNPYQVYDTAGIRFVLLNSAWIPQDGDTAHNRFVRGQPITEAQLKWLGDVLDDQTAPSRMFVFLHHLLWWDPEEGAWWQDVHPLLREHGVRAVVSGDYGPLKFSHLTRDGIDYFQTSLGGDPSVRLLKSAESNRILAAQFDNFLHVSVRDEETSFEVITLGEMSSGHFSPAKYTAVFRTPGERLPLGTRVWLVIGSPARLVGLGTLLLLSFLAGVLASWLARGRSRA